MTESKDYYYKGINVTKAELLKNAKQDAEKPKKQTAAQPAISLTIPLSDATNLAQGSVWSEMNMLHELEALLAKGVEQVNQTGKSVHLILTIDTK